MESKRILFAEDNPHDVELTLNALEGLGLADEVAVVRDGVEALDYLRCNGAFAGRPGGLPLFLLMDLKMPRMDGVQVLAALREDHRLKALPVVMLTSSREEVDLSRCYALGVNAYVVKPVSFEEFRNAVETLGSFWASLNEPPPQVLAGTS